MMLNLVKRVMTDENGASAAEYAILVALVGAAVVAAALVFGDGLSNLFGRLETKFNGWVT